MPNSLRSIKCSVQEFWSDRGISKDANTHQDKWFQHDDNISNAFVKVDEVGNIWKMKITWRNYETQVESQDGFHFHGYYSDPATDPGYHDKGDVHFRYYRSGTRHCFVGHYKWNDSNGSGYEGLYYVELEEIGEL